MVSTPLNGKELSFEEKKGVNREISRIEKSIATVETRIATLEEAISAMDALLADSSRITSGEVFLKYEKTKQELAAAFAQWEKEHEELEEWQSKKYW